MRLAVFLIPGLALAGLALAVRRHRLAARQRAASVHQGADVLKWRSRRRNKQAAVQQDGNAHKNVDPAPLAKPPKNVELAPVVTLPQQRTPPLDAAAVPADAALGAAARRVKLGELLVRQGHGAGSAAVRALLKAGRVTVNGALERSYARKIADGFDVKVHASAAAAASAVAAAATSEGTGAGGGGDGGEGTAASAPHLVVWCKPCGVVCSLGDDGGGRTNLQGAITADGLRRPGLHPVGRLDCHSCGLMLWRRMLEGLVSGTRRSRSRWMRSRGPPRRGHAAPMPHPCRTHAAPMPHPGRTHAASLEASVRLASLEAPSSSIPLNWAVGRLTASSHARSSIRSTRWPARTR